MRSPVIVSGLLSALALLLSVALSSPLSAQKPKRKYRYSYSMSYDSGYNRTFDPTLMMRYAGNIHLFNREFPQEKVYLQFDNTCYYQGETVWFKAFVVNASNLTRATSTILYVDLLSPNGVLLEQKKVKLTAGQGDGSFTLVDVSTAQARSLRGILPYPSGYYEIRAYTQFQLNFSDDLTFSRVIPVYKTPLSDGDYSHPQMDEYSDRLENLRPKNTLKTVNVSFYPEGGHLLNGMKGRVAFKAVDEKGRGLDGTLELRGGQFPGGVMSVRSGHEGMGSFIYDPGQSAGAQFVTGGKAYGVTLPSGERNGLLLRAAMDTSAGLLTLTYRYRDEKSLADSLGITVTCRGELIYFGKVSTRDSTLLVPTSRWPAGVCRVVLYTRGGQVLASRSVFHNNTGFTAPGINVRTDKESYSANERMKLSLTLRDKDGRPFRDRFCLSVRDDTYPGGGRVDNMIENLLLCSDLKGYIHNPGYYFESDDSAHLADLDLLMLVQGWERYDWRKMSGNEPFVERHRLEDSLTLNGWVLMRRGRKDRYVNEAKVYVTIASRSDSLVEYGKYLTEEIGYFGFNTKDFYGKAELLMLVDTRKDEKSRGVPCKIRLERAYVPPPRLIYMSECEASDGVPGTRLAFDASPETPIDAGGVMLPTVNVRERRKYIDYLTFRAYDVEKDVEVTLDNGEYPKDMMGYLLDKGYAVWNRQDMGRSFRDSVSDGFTTHWLDGRPVFWYMHDAKGYVDSKLYVPTQIDTRDVVSVIVFDDVMPLSEIREHVPLYMEWLRRRIDMDAEMRMNGVYGSGRYVLVDILLKEDGTLLTNKQKRNLGQRITTLTGLSQPYMFYSPEYPDGPIENEDSLDYRRTLYWNPNVITDADGHAEVEFYNNSYSRHFSVSGAGITASGTPYVLDATF